MPSALCAGNSLPMDPTSRHLMATRVGQSPQLFSSQPKLLKFEALNRSFHNAAALAQELKESVQNPNNGICKSRPSSVHSKRTCESPLNLSDSPSSFVRHISIRFKSHVQNSLSDPLKRKASQQQRRTASKDTGYFYSFALLCFNCLFFQKKSFCLGDIICPKNIIFCQF